MLLPKNFEINVSKNKEMYSVEAHTENFKGTGHGVNIFEAIRKAILHLEYEFKKNVIT